MFQCIASFLKVILLFYPYMYIYYSLYLVTCIFPAPPLNGALLTNTNQTESSVITFQCDPGFSLVGTETATCNNSGLWDPDPALLECMFINVPMPVCMLHIDFYIGEAITGAWIAALSGGVVAIVMVLILLVVILVVTITKKRKSNGN